MLNRDFKEFIQSLNDNLVRYLIVGGYAVAFHGHPRYTKDIDIWIDMTPENAENIVRSLEQFGFESLGLKKGDFLIQIKSSSWDIHPVALTSSPAFPVLISSPVMLPGCRRK